MKESSGSTNKTGCPHASGVPVVRGLPQCLCRAQCTGQAATFENALGLAHPVQVDEPSSDRRN
jgi:hypothetical protein